MNPIYAEFRSMAEEMLAEFGTEAYLLKPGPKTGPEHRPTIGEPIRKRITVFRITKTITSPNDARLSITKNSFLISTIGRVKVEDNDQIEFGDSILTIQTVKEIAPAGLTVLWNATVAG